MKLGSPTYWLIERSASIIAADIDTGVATSSPHSADRIQSGAHGGVLRPDRLLVVGALLLIAGSASLP